jgi:hypothetical protein
VSLLSDVERKALEARTCSWPAAYVDLETLDAVVLALKEREVLATYARHRLGCLSTLPACICGLTAALEKARA